MKCCVVNALRRPSRKCLMSLFKSNEGHKLLSTPRARLPDCTQQTTPVQLAELLPGDVSFNDLHDRLRHLHHLSQSFHVLLVKRGDKLVLLKKTKTGQVYRPVPFYLWSRCPLSGKVKIAGGMDAGSKARTQERDDMTASYQTDLDIGRLVFCMACPGFSRPSAPPLCLCFLSHKLFLD